MITSKPFVLRIIWNTLLVFVAPPLPTTVPLFPADILNHADTENRLLLDANNPPANVVLPVSTKAVPLKEAALPVIPEVKETFVEELRVPDTLSSVESSKAQCATNELSFNLGKLTTSRLPRIIVSVPIVTLLPS